MVLVGTIGRFQSATSAICHPLCPSVADSILRLLPALSGRDPRSFLYAFLLLSPGGRTNSNTLLPCLEKESFPLKHAAGADSFSFG